MNNKNLLEELDNVQVAMMNTWYAVKYDEPDKEAHFEELKKRMKEFIANN